jgi:hypothetical protein
MNQSSLDMFQERKQVLYVTVLVLVDIGIAWTDRDWHFHAQDIVDIDSRLAELMVRRGMARMLSLEGYSK